MRARTSDCPRRLDWLPRCVRAGLAADGSRLRSRLRRAGKPQAPDQAASPEARSPKPPAGKAWTPPRTPWGDPDLQGNYTNKYEQGTPFERPDEFAGRKIEDLKSDELKDILQERQDRALLSITLAGGDPAGNLGGPLWWQDQFEVNKGSRPWFVIDPTDGKIPPMTPEAQQRIAARAAVARANARQRRRLLHRSQPLRPLHHARAARVDDAGDLRQLVPDRAGPGLRRDPLRDDPRDARHPARRPAARRQDDPQLTWATRAATGKATRWWSRRRTSETRASTATAIPATLQARRALHPDRAGHASSGRSPSTIPTTWTRPWTFAMPLTMNDERADHGVRVPRRESRDGEHPQRRARRGGRRQERTQVVDERGADGGGRRTVGS